MTPLSSQRVRAFARLLAPIALSVALPGITQAALGDTVASVEVDRVRMKAVLKTSQTALYTVHEMQTPSGTTVRPSGRFGHSHRAVERPDLVVRSSGHLRSFFGLAYVPQLLPAGVAADQLK